MKQMTEGFIASMMVILYGGLSGIEIEEEKVKETLFIIFAFYVLISCYYLPRIFGVKKASIKESLIIVLFITALSMQLYMARTEDSHLLGDNMLLDFALYSFFYYIQILIVLYFFLFGGIREKGMLFLKLPLVWFLKKEQRREFVSKISSDYNELFSDTKHRSICLKWFLAFAALLMVILFFSLSILKGMKV